MMKKLAAVVCVAVLVLTLCPLSGTAAVKRSPGGLPAFIVGCCWGIREGSMWNEGSDMHWREWVRIVPIVSLIVGIWDGIECYNGVTSHAWAEANGANWY